VERAGKLLRGRIEAVDDNALAAFEVAHNWRNAHVLPMRKLRSGLSLRANRVNPTAIAAGRLKRMKSIRRKLARLPYTLYQMQDIGGCRAIMPSISDMEHLLASYDEGARHELVSVSDYIAEPKRGGYRSHHRVHRFAGTADEDRFRHQLVELQVRTQLQHAWATAVEAVGLVRGEDLKGGEGDADWLRFFALMSSEFADEEGCPLVPSVSENPATRREEIINLDARLRAVVNLDSYVRVIHTTERAAPSAGQIFVIQYAPERREVDVRTFNNYAAGSRRLEFEEARGGVETVLVEVDKAADLRSAYPNYYLDVRLFLGRLRDVIEGRPRRPTANAVAAPQTLPSLSSGSLARPKWSIDLDWWFNRRRR
jgi:hypothetical protein